MSKAAAAFPCITGVKCIGYTFCVPKGKCQLAVRQKPKNKTSPRPQEPTSRDNGCECDKREQKQGEHMR